MRLLATLPAILAALVLPTTPAQARSIQPPHHHPAPLLGGACRWC